MKKVNLKKAIESIEKEKIVLDWLDGLSKNSRRTYLNSLAEFTKVIRKTPQKLLDQSYKEIKERKAPWELSINEWFTKYEAHCVSRNRAKATRDIRTSIIKSFFHFYKINTPTNNTRRRKINNLKVKNKRPGLTKEDIKHALSVCKTLRLKAIILTQVSSGLSISDVVNLRVKEFKNGLIEIDGKKVCLFRLHRQKTDREFSTFISFEAVEAILNYLETERKEYGSDDFLFSNYFKNKPVTADLIQKDFRVLNESLNNKQKEKGLYRAITSHMCRKFFNTELTNDGMTYEIRKHMMGHTLPNKVDNSYYLENSDELLEAYIKHIGSLTIHPTKTITLESKEYTAISSQNEQLKQEIKQIKADNNQEMHEMEKRMELLEKLMADNDFANELTHTED